MKNPVNLLKILTNIREGGDILNAHVQPRIIVQMHEVFQSPGCQVVKYAHLVPVSQKSLDQMTTDKTGAAGYQNST